MSPVLILEKYLTGKDYIEIKQLYKTLLTTPGEPRISRENFIKSIRDGVKEGIFGFGVVKDSTTECLKFKEMPDVSLQDYEAIIKKELCEREEYEIKEAEAMGKVRGGVPEVYVTPTSKAAPTEDATHVSPIFQESVINSIILEVKVPKGKFSEFYRYVLKLIENSFAKNDVIIRIEAEKGNLKKSDYENKVKETLYQINAEIMNEKLE